MPSIDRGMNAMGISYRMFAADYLGPMRQFQALTERRMEAAALIATDRAAKRGVANVRQQMQGARLGRLGNGVGAMSDMEKGGIHRRGGGWSASGTIYIRSRSERTRGAIESYTAGADIRPVRSRWLWIPTDEIPRVTGRYRMTPELYRKNGFESKIGPLVMIKSVNGNPLLVARNIGVSAAGMPRKAKSLTKGGRPKKGQRIKEFSVMFIGIPRTARAARIDVAAIIRQVQQELPELFRLAVRDTV